ncbi:iron-sulfur cluster biosynthesis family protein [Sediminibacillus albus]|uniref:Uncharacterized protein YqkB n=1 Tax=Sediminibacillus albus TaxID=407036 RepID=A0A1G8VJK8_9BACI|nr:iron-sulfur cluster biosynthesis family protein [Sediminibacillus albus]SDJ66087.1 Uncharacterized protein YqkB [Sediminibacillus albus]
MHLAITDTALQKIYELMTEKEYYLQLFYDTEGCCGVNGVPTLRLSADTWPDYVKVHNKHMDVVIHPQQAAFFEKEMTLDFRNHTFRLSSPQGILNGFISPNDLLKGDVP